MSLDPSITATIEAPRELMGKQGPPLATRDLCGMGAAASAAAIRSGEITSEQLVEACLNRISERENVVRAWTYFDPAHALAQARAADRMRAAGKSLGALHGVPVGVKDIFDTADMPTEYGSVYYAGRQPNEDAMVVSLLRRAGAVIMGKTEIPEFASSGPVKTANPLDLERTPGGSSSGSAAVVTDRMVPLAIGSQTTGSIIRPASYCGIYGYKPTYGSISRYGALHLSRRLDHVGLLARSLEDIALVADQLMEFDPRDPDMRPELGLSLLESLSQKPSATPHLAFIRTPVWDQADEDARLAYDNFVKRMGQIVEEVELPPMFDRAVECHTTIYDADIAESFTEEYEHESALISAYFRGRLEKGQRILATDYIRALQLADNYNQVLKKIFERYEAILTPAAPSEAPLGPDATGRAIFSMIWTLCGTPTVTVPVLECGRGMPLGVQVVGRQTTDARLLRTARWLVDFVQA